MSEMNLKPWQLLVLSRVFAAGEKGAGMADLRKALKPLLDDPRQSEQDKVLAAILETLIQRGLCAPDARGRATRWRCTPAGERMARESLQLGDSGPPPAWPKLMAGPLMAVSLGVVPHSEGERKLLASAPGLRAAVLRRSHGLPVREIPTAKQSADALLWKQLGVETDAGFTMEAVKKHLLGQALNLPAGNLSSSRLIAQLASQAAGARRNEVGAVREGLLRQWLQATPPGAEPETAPTRPVGLDMFAEHVLEAARHTRSGWFGNTLVFIHAVHATYAAETAGAQPDLQAFKDRLVEAHRLGLLELARADLVSAMNPEDVAKSATRYLSGTFHLIRVPDRG